MPFHAMTNESPFVVFPCASSHRCFHYLTKDVLRELGRSAWFIDVFLVIQASALYRLSERNSVWPSTTEKPAQRAQSRIFPSGAILQTWPLFSSSCTWPEIIWNTLTVFTRLVKMTCLFLWAKVNKLKVRFQAWVVCGQCVHTCDAKCGLWGDSVFLLLYMSVWLISCVIDSMCGLWRDCVCMFQDLRH